MSSTRSAVDVVVLGGGVIGMASAWRAAQGGATVTVVDPEPGAHASSVAAGMLAPVTEAHFGEEALLRLNLAASDLWPDFAAEVEDAGGTQIGYAGGGTLVAALDIDDNAALDHLFIYQRDLKLPVRRLRSREVRALEPMLAPSIRSGMIADGDQRVEPVLLNQALRGAAESAGVTFVAARGAVVVEGDRAVGVDTPSGEIRAGHVVLAAGPWSASVDGLPDFARPPVRPVKGQILTLRGEPLLTRAVRGMVKGTSIYLVPRADGRVVIGATVEERGWDTTVTAGGLYELLRDAVLLVPGLSELELHETRAGLRPGSPDNAPLIGLGGLAGLVVATGHFRNGILLTPVTADAVASIVLHGKVPDLVAPFDPRRFAEGAMTATGAAR